ncbi:MAG: AAA family ATPase [Proteobacteria bacterium]|nr:AAA family ATPase [Pseudomonadota bacterium]
MAKEFVQELYLHLEAGYPLIFVLSQEEKRAMELVRQATEKAGSNAVTPRSIGQTASVGELLQKSGNPMDVMVLDDVHRRLDDPDTLRALADLGNKSSKSNQSTIVLAPWVDLPPEIERLSAVLELPLPTPSELANVLGEVCAKQNVDFAEDDATKLVRVAQGLTEEEARRAFNKATLGGLDSVAEAIESVATDKRLALRRSRVLENVDMEVGLNDVGGLDRLKEWLHSREDGFSDKAAKYGLPAPKGLFLMGIQGCGKSLMAKAVAGHWNLPLVRLDLSTVFGSPRPEEALSSALRVGEAMAPVVLWIDEIEKGFDRGGEGPAARLLGGMVTWLQEKQKEVFVVATANRVANLPPELPRKGRFDEIFFVDLPNFHERCDILKLHLEKRGRNPGHYSVEALAKNADKLTGSELEQLIISAMYSAFSNALELEDGDLVRALKETVPLYDTFEEEIKALREWARKRARPASTDRRKVDLFKEGKDQTRKGKSG